ncbi:MAG: long-chain fatty acid--CoA ligase [Anaerolineales bacterium]|nr:long-chain fatty acid--CoA ligase [Anaerolineales bacterium]
MSVMPSEKPWLKIYDEGVPHTIEIPPIPAFGFLESNAIEYPNNPALIFKGHIVSYKELDDLTDRLAAGLAASGVAKGDRVCILMPNTPQFIIAFYGILKAGGVVVATNPLYTAGEIADQVSDAGAVACILTSNFYDIFKKAQPKTPVKTVIVSHIKDYMPSTLRLLFPILSLVKSDLKVHNTKLRDGDTWLVDVLDRYPAALRPKVEIGPEDIAMFQYTGGTTGVSKGAVNSHRALVANSLQIKTWMPDIMIGKETVLMAIPLFHVYGMVAGMSFGIASAAGLVLIPNPRDMDDLLDNISKFRPSIYPGVPAMYNAINVHPKVISGKVDVTCIRACISGSAPLMRETKETFERLTGASLREGYGLSEAPTASHCNPMMGENRTGSIGLPLPGVECRIVNLQDGETDLPSGEEGELVLRSPNLMNGYWQMPTETSNAIRDGWLFTGDIASMDEDGYFFIIDRKKELIKPGGYQVWPREVEEVLSSHPKILEAGVAGIPDQRRGETVKAWVVLLEGQSATSEEIRAYCREHLAPFKVPTEVEFMDALPKTFVGKVLRRELRRQEIEKKGQ